MRTQIEYPEVLTLGGDDRCTIGKKGVNKYHCGPGSDSSLPAAATPCPVLTYCMVPEPIPGALFRGSCTCNIPTERAYAAAQSAFEKIQTDQVRLLPQNSGPDWCPNSLVWQCETGSVAGESHAMA
eukprot:2672772-Rhodomonas_salina.1